MITTQGLTKYYGKTLGIENLDLKIKKGETFGLLGPNGAGKTTTIRLLLGLLKPTKGTAKINKLDCWDKTVEIKRLCGYIPGDVRLLKNYTGRRLINLYSQLRGSLGSSDNLIYRLNFDSTKKVKQMSKGNRQKLAIILALMHQPEVLILDEPTSGLDPLMQKEFFKLIEEAKERGSTTLYSSHFLPEVERICDRAAIIKEGNLIAVEEIKKLRDKAKDLSKEHSSLEEVFMEYYE